MATPAQEAIKKLREITIFATSVRIPLEELKAANLQVIVDTKNGVTIKDLTIGA